MLTVNRKSVFGIMMAATFLASPAVLAQESSVSETIDDITLELEEMPPQPVQTTIPEEEVSVESEPMISTTVSSGNEVLNEKPMAEMNVKQPEPVVDTPAVEPVADAPAAEPTEPLTPVPEETETASSETNPEPIPHSGQYYDSDSIAPDPGLGGIGAPREVDPRYEPGSTFVVVSRTAGPETRSARLIAAQRALKLGRYSSALEMYEQLYKQYPKSHQVLMGLAVAQQQNGFSESAIATYEELLMHEPKNTDAIVNMLGILKTQYPSVAYRKLKELWEKNSENPVVAAQLGLASASLGNAHDAIRYLGVAATLEPSNPFHFYNMAVISDRAGAHKDAVDLYEKALELDAMSGSSRSIPRDEIYDRLSHLRRL